jgi:hypothetical protein
MNQPLHEQIPALYNKHGSLKAIARTGRYGNYNKVQRAYRKAIEEGLITHVALGRKPHTHTKFTLIERAEPLKTKKARSKAYILTCAQNNTLVHEPTWQSLKAYAEYLGAEIYVSQFMYAKRGLGQTNDKANLSKSSGHPLVNDIWFDPAILPYINNSRVEIAPGLVWCGELNILPTAEKPLRGLESYTGRASMIVPHTHLQMQSIATTSDSGTKFSYTTGTVTQHNYIQRKEGFKAEFHHINGALIVEVDDNGSWWVRQLSADSAGTIHDLDVKISEGKITTGNSVEAITFGDAHVAQIDPEVRDATWGPGGMVDVLKPRFQFIHDVFDGYARSHHAMKDPYKMFKRFAQGMDSVEAEVQGVADFLRWIKRDDCQTVVVNSNHDRHIGRWLAENDGRRDPVNAAFWSKLNSKTIQHIEALKEEPDHLELALQMVDPRVLEEATTFLLSGNDSFVICPEHSGGIECALHFDIGSNGARGTLGGFAKMGRRSNGGHSHSAGIDGGAYQAGCKIKLRVEYNMGPSSWSWSDIITHENGKRQIVTFYKSGDELKWRA